MERTPEQEELYTILAEQTKQLRAIQIEQEKIKNRLNWMLVGDYLRIAIIVLPIVIGIVYLAPFAKTFVDQFSRLSSPSGSGAVTIDALLKTLNK